MPPPSLARQFFESVVGPADHPDADRAAAIRRLIGADPPTFEYDWRDFKREEANPRHRDAKYKEQLSEAVSGFGNAGGGVVIWGVVATKVDLNGVPTDHAHAEEPVENPVAVAEKLRGWAKEATDPPLGGIEVVAVPLPGRPDRGFVACYVPDGPHKPYRAEMVDRKPFYLRAGDATPVMPYRALAAMFYPKASPVFRASAVVRCDPPENPPYSGSGNFSFDCQVLLTNAGEATAGDVYVVGRYGLPGRMAILGDADGARHASGGPDGRGFHLPNPLHPSLAVQLSRIESTLPIAVYASWSLGSYPPVKITLTVYCRDHLPQRLEWSCGLEQLVLSREVAAAFEPVDSQT